MKRKQLCIGLELLLLMLCISGCKKSAEPSQSKETPVETVQVNTLQSTPDNQTLENINVMDRIIENQGLNNAVDYDSKTDDPSKDTIVQLCQSESGQYTAYGFISPEYGKKGILINNVINGQSNWNYFDEYPWSFGTTPPALQEQGDYDVLFSFTAEHDTVQELHFETYDTGTMSVKE